MNPVLSIEKEIIVIASSWNFVDGNNLINKQITMVFTLTTARQSATTTVCVTKSILAAGADLLHSH